MLVVRVDAGVVVSGAVGPTVAAVQGAVERADAGVRVLVLRDPLRRAADVQDLCVVPFPGLTLTQLSGLCLDPEGEEDGNITRLAEVCWFTLCQTCWGFFLVDFYFFSCVIVFLLLHFM